jgi:hypothetical protein
MRRCSLRRASMMPAAIARTAWTSAIWTWRSRSARRLTSGRAARSVRRRRSALPPRRVVVVCCSWVGLLQGVRSRPGRRVPARDWPPKLLIYVWATVGQQDVRGRPALTNAANAGIPTPQRHSRSPTVANAVRIVLVMRRSRVRLPQAAPAKGPVFPRLCAFSNLLEDR